VDFGFTRLTRAAAANDASEMAKRWFKSQMFDGVSEDFLGGAEQSSVNEAAGRRN